MLYIICVYRNQWDYENACLPGSAGRGREEILIDRLLHDVVWYLRLLHDVVWYLWYLPVYWTKTGLTSTQNHLTMYIYITNSSLNLLRWLRWQGWSVKDKCSIRKYIVLLFYKRRNWIKNIPFAPFILKKTNDLQNGITLLFKAHRVQCKVLTTIVCCQFV